jgi:rubrerythrin
MNFRRRLSETRRVEGSSDIVTCKSCQVAMKELKGHVYHKKRKWQCPRCKRVRMQVHKPR